MPNVLRDPLQGYDIKISVVSVDDSAASANPRLAGAFNSLMWRTITQTEAYLPTNQRIPRLLDGEVITVWSLDQGLVNLKVVANTFGTAFADDYTAGRASIIARQSRFDIRVQAGVALGTMSNTNANLMNSEVGFNLGGGTLPNTNIVLKLCRVDTLTFGIAPGRAVVANSWQGTAEGVDDGPSTT